MSETRCGYVALLGQPNAGKSTLFNSLVGHKLAGVSRKRQTTRNRVLGVLTQGDAQVLFLDTPGLHRSAAHGEINRMMNREAIAAAEGADVLCYLIDPFRGWDDMDGQLLGQLLSKSDKPILILATKTDRFHGKKVDHALDALGAALEQFMQTRGENPDRLQTQAVSAKRPAELVALRERLQSMMPIGPWLFEEDALTDRPETFVCAELIREQLFRRLSDELPYGAAVVVEKIEDQPKLVKIDARIVVARASHKGMVLGKSGAAIKGIGAAAREALERHFDKKVYLALHVVVAENWTDDRQLIAELTTLQDI